MDLTVLVDVAIGLSLVYLGASLFVTIVNEYIAQALQLRGRQLAGDLKKLIDDPAALEKLKASPALKPFFEPGTRLGSYVDPNVLAQMLVGGLRAGKQGLASMPEIIDAIDRLPPSGLKSQLQALSQTVKDDVDAYVQKVAAWADRSLTMLGEAYKRHTQLISFAVGFGLAVALNLDTFAVTGELYRDKDAREAIAGAAVELAQKVPQDVFDKCMAMSDDARRKDSACAPLVGLAEGLKHRNAAFGKLPIGWPAREEASASALVPCWITRPAGWLLTALAISLGASFWFDLLNRLVNMRHGMRRPEAAGK